MGKVCFLCKSSEDDELLFGKFYTKWRLSVHYYCLLLSSNLVQNGVNDTVGIFGFLEQDIRKENERTKKCRCYICKEMHANVSCCSKKCLRTFHTVCGIKNRCLSHYTDTFQSWCAAHIPVERDTRPHTSEEPCSICYDEMGKYDRVTSIRAPCCRNGWFHQRCVAQYAQSAGYFFKCPLCNNEDIFLPEIPRRGVFVPERDAAWELEPNAFQEQLVRPTACDAEVCKCQEGRSIDNHQWRLVICGSCGSTCRHRQCMEAIPELTRAYVCLLCRPILGERVSLVEDSDDDSGDSSEDDTVSSSSSSSEARFGKARTIKELLRPGSGESGVHCSSSDETLAVVRRRAHRRVSSLSSDGSDSERSDTSSVQIRRFVQLNTGKRVRRLLSDGSDEGTSNPVGEKEEYTEDNEKKKKEKDVPDQSEPVGISKSATGKLSEADTKSTSSLSLSVDRSPVRRMDEIPNVSDSSYVVCNRFESKISPEIRGTRLLGGRRPRLLSSSDDSDKRSEKEEHISDGLDDVPLTKYCQITRSYQANNRRTSRKHQKTPISPSELSESIRAPADSIIPKHSEKKVSDIQPEARRSTDEKKADKTSVQQVSQTEEKQRDSNESDAYSLSVTGRRTRQLSRRLSSNSSSIERTTSESSNDIVKPKRAIARRPRLVSSSDRSERLEDVSEHTDSSAPQSKRRRVSREHRYKTRIISPPSTPPSLASETSQHSAASSSSGINDASEDLKHITSSSTFLGSTPNRQQHQQSILKFISLSSHKTTPSSSSDVSTEETISPSRMIPYGNGGSGKQESSNKKTSGSKRAIAAKRKRSSTDSPKRSRTLVDTGKKHLMDSNGSTQGPTTSKATAASQLRSVAPQRIVEKKV
uniref:PHD-type domain-containing protein n=1 Tax=Anopheles christyi TaxID=43041 RepID=A0A182JXQ4_9DIPT